MSEPIIDHADALTRVLAESGVSILEPLMAHAARCRLGDLESLAGVIGMVHELAEPAAALAALAHDIAAGDGASDARLRSPIMCGWLSDFGRIEDWREDDDPHLRALLARTGNMRWSLGDTSEFTAVLAVEQGVLMTADCSIAIGGISGEIAGVQKSGRRLALVDQFGARSDYDLDDPGDPRILRAPALAGTRTWVRNDLPWLRLALREGAVPTRAEGIEPWRFDARDPYYSRVDHALLIDTAALLAEAWPERHAELAHSVCVLVQRSAPVGWEVEGFTVSSHQGACWIFSDTPVNAYESLIHEQGHVKLRHIEEAIPILLPDQPPEHFHVSWREDPRPVVGITEGVFVHLQVCEALDRALAKGLFAGSEASFARERADDLRTEVAEAIPILERHARFTRDGERFLRWARDASGLGIAMA